RLRSQRRAPRYRQQAGIPESGGLFRAEAAGSRRQVLGLPRVARPAGAGRQTLDPGHYVAFEESFDGGAAGVVVDDDVSDVFAAGVSLVLESFESFPSFFSELP